LFLSKLQNKTFIFDFGESYVQKSKMNVYTEQYDAQMLSFSSFCSLQGKTNRQIQAQSLR